MVLWLGNYYLRLMGVYCAFFGNWYKYKSCWGSKFILMRINIDPLISRQFYSIYITANNVYSVNHL